MRLDIELVTFCDIQSSKEALKVITSCVKFVQIGNPATSWFPPSPPTFHPPPYMITCGIEYTGIKTIQNDR